MAFSRSGVSKVACPIRLGLIMGTFLLVVLRRSAGVDPLTSRDDGDLGSLTDPNHRMSSGTSAIFGTGNKAAMTGSPAPARAGTARSDRPAPATGAADQTIGADALDKLPRFG